MMYCHPHHPHARSHSHHQDGHGVRGQPRRQLRCQRGAAAIEAAFILVYSFAMLPMALYLTRYTLHSAVLQQAVQDTARFMSSLPPEDILEPDRKAAALLVARSMIDQSMAGAQLDTPLNALEINCDASDCADYSGSAPPSSIHVTARIEFGDPVFINYTGALPPQYPVYEARLHYGY